MSSTEENVIEVQDIMNAIWVEAAPTPRTDSQSAEIGDGICFITPHVDRVLVIAGNYATRIITCTIVVGYDSLAPIILHFSQYSVDDFHRGGGVSITDYGKMIRDRLLDNN